MKKILAWMMLTIVGLTLSFSQPALADAGAGAKVFAANCAACHMGGKNAVNPAKTLKLADLENNKLDSEAAIVTQVTKGKGAMPSFKGRLSDAQIADVAAYVLAQAEKGW